MSYLWRVISDLNFRWDTLSICGDQIFIVDFTWWGAFWISSHGRFSYLLFGPICQVSSFWIAVEFLTSIIDRSLTFRHHNGITVKFNDMISSYPFDVTVIAPQSLYSLILYRMFWIFKDLSKKIKLFCLWTLREYIVFITHALFSRAQIKLYPHVALFKMVTMLAGSVASRIPTLPFLYSDCLRNDFILCVICARGSKGLPNKNIRMLHGIPLIGWSIKQALPGVDQVIVSTDSSEIASVSREFGAIVPFMRPPELALSNTSKFHVFQHAYSQSCNYFSCQFDMYLDLDCTSPFVLLRYFIRHFYLVSAPTDVDGVFSVSPAHKNPYFNIMEPTRMDISFKVVA